jgi:hypothetical protein
MASSHEILASPHETPAEPGQRQRWADNLRVLVIAVVVVWQMWHTATAYLGDSDWYYMGRTTWKVWTTRSFGLCHLSLCAGTFVAGRRLVLRTFPGSAASAVTAWPTPGARCWLSHRLHSPRK